MVKRKKTFYFANYGFSRKDFQKWGKLGGRPKKYVSAAERQKAYRRRKALARIDKGEIVGILNLTTGRINKIKPKKLCKLRQGLNRIYPYPFCNSGKRKSASFRVFK